MHECRALRFRFCIYGTQRTLAPFGELIFASSVAYTSPMGENADSEPPPRTNTSLCGLAANHCAAKFSDCFCCSIESADRAAVKSARRGVLASSPPWLSAIVNQL